MSKLELSHIPLKPGTYIKPERTNLNVPDKKYDKVDHVCEKEVFISNDGNVYVPETAMSSLFNTDKHRGKFLFDNRLSEENKRNISGINAVKSSGVVGLLDEKSHETRDAEDAAIYRYSRDALIGIGDSDQAEAERRKLDAYTKKELPKLKKQRGVAYDEVTGEPLEKSAAFHHEYEKEVFTDPIEILDENKGINVNLDTHKEIHRRKIRTKEELEVQKEDIKNTLKKKKED